MKRKAVSAEQSFFWAIPALVWQGLLLYVPLFFMLVSTFLGKYAGSSSLFTLSFYTELFSTTYLHIISRSLILSCTTACICLIIAYPVAYYLALHVGRFKNILLFFLIMPFWSSLLVQVYAWFSILDSHGLFNTFLQKIGLFNTSIHLLNTPFAVYLVMVYCYVPFMLMPIYSILEKFDRRLQEASFDLGATGWKSFLTVTLPLSLPGIRTGFFLVMIPSFGEFVIPMLLGGGKQFYVGSLITHYFLVSRSPVHGAAFTTLSSIILIVAALTMQWLFIRVLTTRPTKKGSI